MLENEPTATNATTDTPAPASSTPTRSRRRAAARPAGPPAPTPSSADSAPAPATDTAAKKTAKAAKKTAKKSATKKTTAKKSAAEKSTTEATVTSSETPADDTSERPKRTRKSTKAAPTVLFQPPSAEAAPTLTAAAAASPDASDDRPASPPTDSDDDSSPRRRRRGGRGRRGRSKGEEVADTESSSTATEETSADTSADAANNDDNLADAEGDEDGGTPASRRRRRRRRRGTSGEEDPTPDDPSRTVVHVREPRKGDKADKRDNEISGFKGSTRLEAKKQRRREGREHGRKRPPVLTESEFLARREAVDRVMVIRQLDDRTQIGVLEDGILVEHYVAQSSMATMVGTVYLGKVQNVLPSMEAAFVDVGRGRNAVLYAGEVNWDAAALDGQPRRIEHAMKSADSVMVQVTKDPIGHKGARLTAQVSLPGRYLVYVPDGSMTGISRKLPDTERTRLKNILKRIVPDDAGVIVRTAAEGASEEELQRDVTRLSAQWESITDRAKTATAPELLYQEPDLTVRVIRDVFNEDFSQLVVSGGEAWGMVEEYIQNVAPDLAPRLTRWTQNDDVFAAHRIDEQLAKALDRKVWLPSGGYLIIDPTEAMTVVDVNTGKFTGSGGNLEQTVTKNNIEAAEEIVRQLRLRDVGGIIVVDFIDMVLESNRDLVLRRLLECLGRDRTKHQVAEVTSLGLVQMTRKRVGQGLLDSFSTLCETCNGRGRNVHLDPVEPTREKTGSKRGRVELTAQELAAEAAKEAAAKLALSKLAAAAGAAKSATKPENAVEPADPDQHQLGDLVADTEIDESSSVTLV